MFWWLVLAIFLFLACAVLIIAEVFVPSGGIISICALGCLIGGIAIFFQHSPAAGWIGIITAVVMIPLVVIIAYKVFPHTRFGKSVTLSPPDRHPGDAIPDTEQLTKMVGSTGIVKSTLRPVGICDFDGKRVECVAEEGFVEKDKKVKVIEVEGTQVTVRLVEET